MPKKIRELKVMLRRAGFVYRPAKGSHSRWYHERLKGEPLTLAGNDGHDAQRYQEKMVERAIEEVRPR